MFRSNNRTNWTARDEGREQQRNMVKDILASSKTKLTRATRSLDVRKDVIYR